MSVAISPATPPPSSLVEINATRSVTAKDIKLLLDKPGPPTSEDLETLRKVQSLFPRLNKTLSLYELLQRKTEKEIRGCQFKPTTISIRGEEFPAFDISHSPYEFIVHAAGLDEYNIQETLEQRKRSGFLCTSYISHEIPDFFCPEYTYAMVLRVDPSVIVKTTGSDSFGPYDSKNPKTAEFYYLQRKMIVLTTYIDQLYAGLLSKEACCNDFQKYLHLRAMQEQGFPIDPEEMRQRIFPNAVSDKDIFTFYQEKGITYGQLEALMRLKPDDEELKELQKILNDSTVKMDLLSSAIKRADHFVCPIQSAHELALQTLFQKAHSDNKWGAASYNEIDLYFPDCWKAKKDLVAVRAILVHPTSFEKQAYQLQLLKVFQNAREKNIPILIQKEELRPLPFLLKKLKSRVSFLTHSSIPGLQWILSQRPDITDDMVWDLFLTAIQSGNTEIAKTLLEARPSLQTPDKMRQAFLKCLDCIDLKTSRNNLFSLLDHLLSIRFELLSPLLAEQMRVRQPGHAFGALFLILKRQGQEFDIETKRKAFPYVDGLNIAKPFAEDLLEEIQPHLSEEDIEKAIKEYELRTFLEKLLKITTRQKEMGALAFVVTVGKIESSESSRSRFKWNCQAILELCPDLTEEDILAVVPEVNRPLVLQIFQELRSPL